jgi:hypothetical protein
MPSPLTCADAGRPRCARSGARACADGLDAQKAPEARDAAAAAVAGVRHRVDAGVPARGLVARAHQAAVSGNA